MSEKDDVSVDSTDVDLEFKKPMLVRKVSKKVTPGAEKPGRSTESNRSEKPDAGLLSSTDIPYKAPTWSGLCPEGTDYALEVLKSGLILQKIELTNEPFYVFGRLSNCEVIMAHPTISRYHAVLQYKALASEDQPAGWYIYDLGSTHGTFLNRERIKENQYVRVRVGHQIKFGLSSRIYIVMGPDFDTEGESDLTVTEIKKRAAQMALEKQRILREAAVQEDNNKFKEELLKDEQMRIRKEEIIEREQARQKEEAIRREKEKMKENEGIDWGMGEDSEEEPDLADNPYASTANEELYLQDPKKTLRGFFSREGIDLEYDCVEKGVGQFSCTVQLPIDDAQGRPVIAEVIHRGKKKEAVVACALEACRILDRVGLLRQAKHESRRRKERDWSADDYYDSDEDTFFDRTGNVEKKRHARMEKLGVVTSQTNKALNYNDLVEKIKELETNIQKEEDSMESVREEMRQNAQYKEHLEDYMKTTGAIPNCYQSSEQKEMISKSKLKIKQLQTELLEMRRLAEIARPTDLPPLTLNKSGIPMKKTNSVLYGKRIRLKGDLPKKLLINKNVNQVIKHESEEFVEEVDSDDDAGPSTAKGSNSNIKPEYSNAEASNKETEPSIRINDDTKNSTNIKHYDTEMGSNVHHEENNKKQTPKIIEKEKKTYGPMRPPANYVIPDNYYDQASDRDLPEIMEDTDPS